MCARTTLTNEGLAEIAEALDAEYAFADAALYKRRFNVAPTDLTWIVRFGADRRVLLPAVWGYQTARGRPLINVRSEQVGSGAGFRDAFAGRRCAMVTDGFYEWPGQGQAPFWFHRPEGGLLLLGGLFQAASASAVNSGGDGHPRFTVLTTRPNKLVSAVHDRMPVIVSPQALDDWLTAEPTQAAELLVPAAEDVLAAMPVSKRVNSVRHDDPACIAESAHPPSPTQGSLF
ncbi:MAG TPA: SOS response-associated peptidase [Polyangia bacterium]|jgi:putative SOS response-associated peptidase YedK|nr:SOS response-associated peptidase [Polyangia bacterium]